MPETSAEPEAAQGEAQATPRPSRTSTTGCWPLASPVRRVRRGDARAGPARRDRAARRRGGGVGGAVAEDLRAAEEDVRAATTGKPGLLARSIELDADALMIRATVLTYRWIDDLQEAAYKTLGAIAGRAIGYLAPEVALGGAIVSAGLIETDALDRDRVAAYINELAENNPDLLDHVSSGGGGLLDSLQMRSMLTAGVLAGVRVQPPAGAGCARPASRPQGRRRRRAARRGRPASPAPPDPAARGRRAPSSAAAQRRGADDHPGRGHPRPSR